MAIQLYGQFPTFEIMNFTVWAVWAAQGNRRKKSKYTHEAILFMLF